ncbi:DUF3388 domain-containing protein [Anaerobacillus sp. HL2]|nr:DUF3388 domain-containing protein [Anaerobacillus sp. HL2]
MIDGIVTTVRQQKKHVDVSVEVNCAWGVNSKVMKHQDLHMKKQSILLMFDYIIELRNNL